MSKQGDLFYGKKRRRSREKLRNVTFFSLHPHTVKADGRTMAQMCFSLIDSNDQISIDHWSLLNCSPIMLSTISGTTLSTSGVKFSPKV